MKLAITGHTRGIGKALYQKCFEKGHHVTGYSRSNGYDISRESDRQRIFESISEYDVFINNAYSPKSQYDVLLGIVDHWKDQKKLIINVSSKSVYADVVPSFMKSYVEDKRSQMDFISQRKLKAVPAIMNLVLGLVDTEMSDQLEAKKLSPDDVAELLCKLIEFKDTIYIQDLMIDVPYQDWTDIRPRKQ
jgi:hypothetical protein